MRSSFGSAALVAAIVFSSLSASFADAAQLTLLEIDGNVSDDGGAGLPLDWANLFTPAGVPIPTAGFHAQVFVSDLAAPDASYHAGSDKDIDDLTTWQCAPRNNPQDKTNVLNAYAAIGLAEGRLLLHFGFERASNLGDAYMGFWFLQRESRCENGAFTTAHTPGDLLVLADFTRGGVASTVRVLAWDPAAERNLRVVASPSPCVGAVLDGVACGITNRASVTTPWAPGKLGANQLFEGAIDLSRLLSGETRCFASFVAQTRASQELTAELKDYALAAFPSCEARLRAEPASASAPVGTPQEVRFVAERDHGAGWQPAAGVAVRASVLAGPGALAGPSCTTGADGACRVSVAASVAGESPVRGVASIPLAGVAVDRDAQALRAWFRVPATVVVSPPGSSAVGEPVTVDAGVSGPLGPGTGPVGFVLCRPDGSECAPLGSVPTQDGGATTAPFTPPAAGEWCVLVDYGGDARYEPANGSACFVVLAPASSLTLAARPLPDGAAAPLVAAAPGQLVELTLTYRNAGEAPASAAQLAAQLPARATLVSCAPACLASGTGPGSTLSWSLGDVPAGETRAVTYVIRLDPVFPAGETALTAAATFSTSQEGTGAAKPATIVVAAAPLVSIALHVRTLPDGAFASDATARPGDVVEYRLRVTNDGNADATAVALSAQLPPRSTFVACTGSCSGTFSWDLGALPAGETRDVLLQLRLDPVFPAGSTSLVNLATAASAAGAPVASAPATVLVTASPASALDLAVRALPDGEHATSADARPRDAVEFRLTYRNDGDADASRVVLRDALPAGLTLASCACDVGPAGLEWRLGVVPAGESRVVTLVATVDDGFAAGVTEVLNLAAVATAEEGARSSNSAAVRVHAAPLSSLALAVALPPGAPAVVVAASPGDEVAYSLTYRNDGDASASVVVVSLPLPARATVVACGCAVVDGVLRWDLGVVAPGETRALAATLRLDSAFPAGLTQLRSVAAVDTAEEAERLSNEVIVGVSAAPVSVVALDARALPDGAFAEVVGARPADTVELRVVYGNVGNADAGDARVVLPLPPRAAFVACTASCAITDGVAAWTFGVVPALGSREATLTLRLDPVFPAGVTPLPFVATASTAEEAASVADGARVDVTAAPSTSLDLAVRPLPDGVFAGIATATPADEVEYRLLLRNSGDAPASSVTAVAPLPAGITPVSCTPSCATSADGLAWSLGTVQPGDVRELRLRGLLGADFPAGTTALPMAATATSAEEGARASNVAVVEVVARPLSTVLLEVAVGGGAFAPSAAAEPGDAATFRVTYRNDGDAGATDARLSATLPPHVTLLGCDGCQAAGATLVWTLGDAPRGATAARTFSASLDPVFPAGLTTLTATAAASTAEEGAVGPSTADLLVTAAPLSSLALDVRVGAGAFATVAAARPGDVAEWRLTLRNDGNAPASAVVVTIPVPARSAVESCPAPCEAVDGVLVWRLGSVEAGGARTLTFTARLDALFPAGETPVALVGSVATGEEGARPSNEARVLVVASAALGMSKIALVETATLGGATPFQIAVWNEGDGHARATVVRDALPAGTSFVACDPACVVEAGVVRWLLPSVAAGTSAERPAEVLTVTLRADNALDCVLCNVATLSSIDGEATSEAACLPILPDVLTAVARGESAPFLVRGIGTDAPFRATTATVQYGPGEDSETDEGRLYSVSLGEAGDVRAETFTAAATSTVEDGLSRHVGFAELTNIDILDGLVTARVARAVASADATENGGFATPEGSLVLDARVNGVPVDVRPGQRIPIGPLSYVAFLEREVYVEEPETRLEGWWTTRIIVSAIRVHVAGQLPVEYGEQGLDIVVGRAEGMARYPRAPSCGEKTFPGVEAVAAAGDLGSLDVGRASAPHVGGEHHIQFARTETAEASLSLVDSRADGLITSTASAAQASIEVADACLLPGPDGCRVAVRALKANAAATHGPGGRVLSGSTEIGGLVVEGVEIAVPRGTSMVEIPGLGFLVLQEVATYESDYGEGVVARAVRLVITAPTPAAPVGAEIVLGEARAAAYHPGAS